MAFLTEAVAEKRKATMFHALYVQGTFLPKEMSIDITSRYHMCFSIPDRIQILFKLRACCLEKLVHAGLTKWELAAVESLAGACKSVILGTALFKVH